MKQILMCKQVLKEAVLNIVTLWNTRQKMWIFQRKMQKE